MDAPAIIAATGLVKRFGDLEAGQDVGELDRNTNIRDLARLYMGIAQGLALIGRVQDAPAVQRSIVNAALATLKTG